VNLPDAVLRALKGVHVLAAVLFLGNVIVTGVWSALLFQRRSVLDFRITARVIVITDWIFTVGGAALLVASGLAIAIGRGYPVWETRWIRQGIIGLGIATVVWLVLLVPAQRAMLRLTPADDDELQRVYRRWNVVGWIAVVPILWSLWSMTWKPV